MSYDLHLSYSGRKCFKTCPKSYYFKYILKEKGVHDPRKTIFGSTIGKIFEWFYEEKAWERANPSDYLISRIPDAIDIVYHKEDYIRGTDPNYDRTLKDDLKKYVPLGVETIKEHKLLTSNSVAELDLSITYSSPNSSLTIRMVGIADFVHYNNPVDVWIMDGKAYKQREKYVDSEQLIWYATLHYLKYRVSPTRLGFIYWLFPDNPVSYIHYDSDSMRNLVSETNEIAQKIMDKQFDAKPSGECHRCSYKNICEDGIKYIARRKVETGGRIEDSIFDLENVT